MPLAGCVTLLTTAPAFSNESAVAPLVPVSTLKLIGVSSLVVTVSLVMSTTGLTVMAITSVSVSAPSLVATVICAAPL